jgi:hypothetical protein
MTYSKWLTRLGLLIFVLLASVCLFNYTVDTVGVFRTSSGLLFAAKSLTCGRVVAGFRNIDERQFQQLIIESDNREIDTIVLGSSRSMELRGRLIEGRTNRAGFFNHSVSGASLEDFIAIIGLYESKRGYIPKKIIMGIDPWIFNKNSGQFRWQSIGSFYKTAMIEMYGKEAKIVATPPDIKKYKQLVTWDYTIANVRASLIPSERNLFRIVDTVDTDDYLREPDGSNHYPYAFKSRKDNIVQKEARTYVKPPVYSLEKFTELSNTQLFENFIQFLRRRDVEINLFLPPYHPLTYKLLVSKDEYKIILDVEKYLRLYSVQHNIKLFGSYDANHCNLNSEDFYDAMHWRDVATKRLFTDQQSQAESRIATRK